MDSPQLSHVEQRHGRFLSKPKNTMRRFDDRANMLPRALGVRNAILAGETVMMSVWQRVAKR